MARRILSRKALLSDAAILLYLAGLKLLIHFVFNGGYGYHRDELYFIACGEHLAFGYVDIGPLTPWLGRLSREILGESLFALRFFPALAGAATVFMTGLLARALGAGRFGQIVAALAVIISPAWLLGQNILCLAAFEPVFWVGCALLIVRIIQTGNTRLWFWVGVVAGLGLLNKPSMLFFGVGLVVALLLTPQRRHLLDKWIWLGGLAALVIASPFIAWQIANGWPTVQFVTHLNRDIMSHISVIEFVAGQFFYWHPLNAAIWIAGLAFYFAMREGKPYRVLGWIYVVVFILLAVAKSKIYYLGPAYPQLLAAGGLAIEAFAQRHEFRWMKAAVPAALVAGGLLTATIALPVLPIDRLDRNVRIATCGLLGDAYELTGTFHDMFGWQERVAAVASAYHALSPGERAKCVVFGDNFGLAGAIDFYGARYGLPPVVSTHQNYYLWGPGDKSGEIFIAIGTERKNLERFWSEVDEAVVSRCAECVSGEKELPVYVCRKPKTTLQAVWPTLRPIAFDN